MNLRRTILCLLTGLFPLAVDGEGVTLVPAGSVWKYHAQGANLGNLWVHPAYDDSQWSIGRAQLGYGEGDEATVVPSGPAGARYITTYFRHAFSVSNAPAYTNLVLRLLRDDGAVVYLNGIELVRVGIPGGPVNYQTFAINAAVEGSLFVTPPLNPSLLQEGANLLAVEIHQVSASSTDISFDLELVHDEPLALASFVDLGPHAIFASPAKLSFSAKAAAAQGGMTSLKFYVNNTEVDQRSMFSRLYATFNREFTSASNYNLAISALDNRGFSITSAVDIVVEPAPSQTTLLVGPGGTWKFLDDGSDPGAAWRTTGYNDEAWNAGPAALGYGTTDLGTMVRSNRANGSKITTSYFRRTLDVPDPSLFSKLALRVLGDDGARVYLNGAEVFRNNLPSDPVGTATLALETIEPATFISGALIDSSALFPGINVLAAEVHQASAGPADLIFDLELTGFGNPRLSIQVASHDVTVLSWPYPSTGYRLISSPGLAPADWSEVTNAPAQVGNDLQVTVPPFGTSRFYRLLKAN